MKRATKVNIQDVIIDTLLELAFTSVEYSKITIRKAPEYLLTVSIAQALANKFENIGYQLEMSVSKLLNRMEVAEFLDPLSLRSNGRVDILLTSRKSGKPRHIIEVKRTLKIKYLLKDVQRIKALSLEQHGSKRLQTGYLVAISDTRCDEKREALINDRLDSFSQEVGSGFNISCRYNYLNAGEAGFEAFQSLLVAVFIFEPSGI